MGRQYKKRRLTARAKRLRLLTATFLVLVVAFFAITVPFWIGHFRAENPNPSIHQNAYIGIWSGMNDSPLTFWSIMAIVYGGYFLPIILIAVFAKIWDEIKE